MAFDCQEAVDFLTLVSEAESENRADGSEDLKFSYGEQWPVETMNSRQLEQRPCLTINKVDSYIRQVTNSQRQQRPRIKVHPIDSIADPKTAETLTGLMRHIEQQSDADQAYDTAFNFAARIGWGYFRVITDYIREDSFDQDIYVQQIDNPFTVYFDPHSTLPDGSDAEKCLITDLISKDSFKLQYPDFDMTDFESRATGDIAAHWITKDEIRIAEYFTVEKEKATLVMLSDGTVAWKTELPAADVLAAANVQVIGERESYKRVVYWRKIAGGMQLLEEKKWPGRWIPVIPVYGDQMIMNGKRRKFGLVRFARDPQMMYNFWRTAMTESVAMAPKAKWLMAEGQDEGHENEWARANQSAMAVLRYRQTDTEGAQAPIPTRVQPELPPEGMMVSASAISNDLQAVLGIFDPQTNAKQGVKSGRAVMAEQGQSEQSNFHLYDNLTRSIKFFARQALDLIPKIYDKKRITRIIGEDGKPSMATLNEPVEKMNDQEEAIESILNDVTVGNYDVVMDVGPGYNSKRMEAIDAFTALMGGPMGEEIAKVGGDLVVRLYDAPGMDVLADRLAAMNPAAQVDDKSDVPPQAQMAIKQLQAQLQQAGQQIQAMEAELQSRSQLQQMKEDGATKRTLITATTKAHESEMWAQEERDQVASVERTRMHDTATRAISAQNVAEIDATVQLMLKHLDTKALEDAAQRADQQTANVADSE